MVTADGPRVLEFNCRFGDPEAEAIIPRLGSDLAGPLSACANGTLQGVRLEWIPGACVTVVAASGGYPGPHETGLAIAGLGEAATMPDVFVFHAGTRARDGRVVTSGGRVLAVSALGPSIGEARDRAYDACSRISFEGMHYRKDIGAGVEATAGG